MSIFTSVISTRAARTAVAACVAALTCACDKKESAETGRVSVQGQAGQLHYDSGGEGDGLPVVFLHSFGGDTSHWFEQLGRLREHRRAVAIDLRGHGHSEPPAGEQYTVEGLAEDIATVADALELDRFVLVAHSMGGSAAVAYAGSYPERVAGLLLVGAPGKSDPAIAQQVLQSLEADFDGAMQQHTSGMLTDATPAVSARVRGEMQRVPPERAISFIGAILQYDPLPALRAYRGPVLLIDTAHGDGPAALHNQLPELPRTVIAGTSHWPHLDKPAAFDPLLDRFLAEADARE